MVAAQADPEGERLAYISRQPLDGTVVRYSAVALEGAIRELEKNESTLPRALMRPLRANRGHWLRDGKETFDTRKKGALSSFGNVCRARNGPGEHVTNRSVLTSPKRHLPRCQDSAPYSRASGAPAEAGKREGFQYFCTRAKPLCVEGYVSHTHAVRGRSSEPIYQQAARIALCRCVVLADSYWETANHRHAALGGSARQRSHPAPAL